MTVLRRPARGGFTILEMVVVLAVLVVLGAVLIPTLAGMKGDSRSKAGVDIVRGRMAEARAKAMEDGIAYRLAASTDGKRVRVAPDTLEAGGMAPAADDDGGQMLVKEDDLPETVTVKLFTDENDNIATQDASGWIRLATFLPDGTCREDTVEVEISEPGVAPFIVRLRGLTGVITVYRGQQQQQGAAK